MPRALSQDSGHEILFRATSSILDLGDGLSTMKHGVAFRKFSRPTAHRMLMLRFVK